MNPKDKTQACSVDKYAKLYPDAEIEMTGHSLGGTVVQHIAIHNPDKVAYATAFNPGSNPILHRKEDDEVGKHTNIRTVMTKGSFISNGQIDVADVVLPDPGVSSCSGTICKHARRQGKCRNQTWHWKYYVPNM